MTFFFIVEMLVILQCKKGNVSYHHLLTASSISCHMAMEETRSLKREREWKNGKGNKEKLDTYQDFFALVFQQDGRSTDFVTRSKRCQFQQVILVDNGYFEFCFAFDTSHSCVLEERRESKSQLLLRLVTKLQLEPSAITFPCQHV